MRVLVVDEFPKQYLEAMRGMGLKVDFDPSAKGDKLVEAAKTASILIVRSTEVPAAVFESAKSLSLVIRAGAGVNTIDVKAASEKGVYVANCPGQNAIAVAELAMGLILAVDRQLPDNVAALRAGKWNKKRFSKAKGLFGRKLGLVGTGAIATAVGRRALAFGMEVHAYSRSFTDARATELWFEREQSVLELARKVEILSVHVPGGAGTKNLISREVLEAMPDGAVFVNTSRADVVDQAALLEQARSGRLWVATDVYKDEPKGGEGDFASELAKLPNVYGTHHIGASTEQAQDAIARETVRIVEGFLQTGEVPNCVNVPQRTQAQWNLIVRHLDKVGVVANVLNEIRNAGINVQEIENTVFEGGAAACCKIHLEVRPDDAVVERIRAPEDVIFVDLVELRG